MFLITSIKKVEREVCVADTRAGSSVTSILIGSFYDIQVSINTENLVFEGEVCPAPHGPQVGWSDELSDLLLKHHGDSNQVGVLLFEFHNGYPISFPVAIGRVV